MLFCLCKMKTAATFILVQDGSCGAFIFSRLSISNAKCGLYIHRRRKLAGCPEGKIPLALGSDRGEQHPCWHTAFHHESLVRYYTFVEQMATGNVAHH